jgi:polyisoprenoid-binding protein YceI
MSAPATTPQTRDFDGLAIPAAGTFTLDPSHTTAEFVARHLMVTKVRGRFTDISGKITITDDPLSSSVEATLATASISTGAADRDAHLIGPDFLDVENYPEITFRSTGVKSHSGNEFVLLGDLTIHGATKQVELGVEFDGAVVNPWGQEVIAFSASTEIDREDFGMTWNVALETGGVLVSKKVVIEIEAQAVRQA